MKKKKKLCEKENAEYLLLVDSFDDDAVISLTM